MTYFGTPGHPTTGDIPTTPEFQMLNGNRLRPLTFDDLVTRLIEVGVLPAPSEEGIQATKTAMCELIDIPERQFTGMQGDPTLIPPSYADKWTRASKKKIERDHEHEKKVDLLAYFSQTILEQLPDKGLDKLQEMIAEEQERAKFWEERISSDEEPFLEVSEQERLDRKIHSRVKALEESRFAVRLPALLEILRTDKVMAERGEDFQVRVIKGLGDHLAGADILYRGSDKVMEWYYGDAEHWNDDDRTDFDNAWLAEADLKMLAETYSWEYFASDKGKKELACLPNPVAEAFYISPEDNVPETVEQPTEE